MVRCSFALAFEDPPRQGRRHANATLPFDRATKNEGTRHTSLVARNHAGERATLGGNFWMILGCKQQEHADDNMRIRQALAKKIWPLLSLGDRFIGGGKRVLVPSFHFHVGESRGIECQTLHGSVHRSMGCKDLKDLGDRGEVFVHVPVRRGPKRKQRMARGSWELVVGIACKESIACTTGGNHHRPRPFSGI